MAKKYAPQEEDFFAKTQHDLAGRNVRRLILLRQKAWMGWSGYMQPKAIGMRNADLIRSGAKHGSEAYHAAARAESIAQMMLNNLLI